MVKFHTQNPTLGIFWRALEWKMLEYFVTIWYILRQFGIFYDNFVYFKAFWYRLWSFGMLGTRKIWQP
jgi:hypothetical protein